MRFLPFILLLGIIFNTILCLVFRLKLDRSYGQRFSDLSAQLHQQIINFSEDSLRLVDNYISSNRFFSVSSESQSTVSSDDSPILPVVSSIGYHYASVDARPYAFIGSFRYTIGDAFPHGGTITQIHPDCIILDHSYRVGNSDFTSVRKPSSSLPSNSLSSTPFSPPLSTNPISQPNQRKVNSNGRTNLHNRR